MSASSLNLSAVEEYQSEEDFEQQRGKYASLTKPLRHLEPFRAYAVITPHASSHPILKLADYLYHLRRYSEASEHLQIDRVVDLLHVDET